MSLSCKEFALNSWGKLYKVVKNLQRDDIGSVDVLLIELTGDNNAGHMMRQLFYWWGRPSLASGFVYKSYQDWWKELRLTKSQVYRVHSNGFLENAGVQRVQKQTRKGNPIHYRLSVETFLQKIADFAQVTLETVMEWMEMSVPGQDASENTIEQPEKPEKPFDGKEESPFSENKKALSLKPEKPFDGKEESPITITGKVTGTTETGFTKTGSTISSKEEITPPSIQEFACQFERWFLEDPVAKRLFGSRERYAIDDLRDDVRQELYDTYGADELELAMVYTLEQNPDNPAGYLVETLKHGWHKGFFISLEIWQVDIGDVDDDHLR